MNKKTLKNIIDRVKGSYNFNELRKRWLELHKENKANTINFPIMLDWVIDAIIYDINKNVFNLRLKMRDDRYSDWIRYDTYFLTNNNLWINVKNAEKR